MARPHLPLLPLLPLVPLVPDGLNVVGIEPTTHPLIVHVIPRPAPTRCPAHRSRGGCKHGHYARPPSSLPWQGRPICLRLRLRCFRCPDKACPQLCPCAPIRAASWSSTSPRSDTWRRGLRPRRAASRDASEEGHAHAPRARVPAALSRAARRRDRRVGVAAREQLRNDGRRTRKLTVLDLLPDRDAGSFAT